MTKTVKIVSLLLAFCMLFSLCGCNSNEEEPVIEQEIIYVSGENESTDTNPNNSQSTVTQNNPPNSSPSSVTQNGNNANNNNNNNNTTTQNNTKTKTIKVLAIGNSYSNNTTQYISEIANATSGNATVYAASLYFAGCTIRHHNKMIEKWNELVSQYGLEEGKNKYYAADNKLKYEWLTVNGKKNQIKSLYEAIRYADWDYITIQQSPDGCENFDTYWTANDPAIIKLYDYIQAEYQRDDMKGKKCPPILVHQTWAFNNDMSKNNKYENYPVNYKNNTEMFKKIEETYNLAAQKIKEVKGVEVPIIKSGEVVELAQAKYGYARTASENLADNTLYADNISHLNARGCYLTACLWIETLAKLSGVTIDTTTATFVPPVEGATLEDCQTLQYIAHSVVHGE